MTTKKKPTQELPADWWCEGQTDLTALLEETEDCDGEQPADDDPH